MPAEAFCSAPRPRPWQGRLPSWVPEAACHYLLHTEAGLPIRAVARRAGCHASTVLRQVRRTETRRDDPLVDAALRALGAAHFQPPSGPQAGDCTPMKPNAAAIEDTAKAPAAPFPHTNGSEDLPDAATVEREARRILRRLCEPGAVLAVAEGLEKAAVLRESDGGGTTRTAVVDRAAAQAMALKDWIACGTPGRVARYRITAAGRAALKRLVAEAENRAQGFSEGSAAYAEQHRAWGDREVTDENGRRQRLRFNIAESPLLAIARRRDKDGRPFLSDELVGAGERLREDFELAQMGPRVTQNWDRFLAGGRIEGGTSGEGGGSSAARQRLMDALGDLGPGLADVALRCCCFLEGIETAERRMGWSARSGKIVLRIALQRLARHYEEKHGRGGPLIG